ncbi:MAG: efflux RND transporter periplasmic adaptor subunit [Myxococcota bacterium]|jgi:hypothetical protein|nr:efflux RND transporter periplasmic adaptor subunit [Myxococcota bacterium]
MKDTQSTTHMTSQPNAKKAQELGSTNRLRRVQFWLFFAATLGALLFLLWPSSSRSTDTEPQPVPPQSPVRLVTPGHILIAPESPLNQKLKIARVEPQSIATPVLTVTGTVMASHRPSKGARTNWQFHSPELLTTYTDWQKARTDISFAKNQLDSIKQLAENRVRAQEALVERLRTLVEAGTESERELATARTELLEAQIQGRKELHEAETAWRIAERGEAALGRQLQQAGVEPELFRDVVEEIDIVVADVPEAMLSRVRIGQSCEARFLGVDGQVFTGTVHSISPVLSTERRSLRVLFTIRDPEDLLRPGMFADIGLGTDARDALLMPAEGVVHVGRSDYAMVQAEAGSWRVTPVQVGELRDTGVEILHGLVSGDRVIGQGAILLKPFIVEATQRIASEGGEAR